MDRKYAQGPTALKACYVAEKRANASAFNYRACFDRCRPAACEKIRDGRDRFKCSSNAKDSPDSCGGRLVRARSNFPSYENWIAGNWPTPTPTRTPAGKLLISFRPDPANLNRAVLEVRNPGPGHVSGVIQVFVTEKGYAEKLLNTYTIELDAGQDTHLESHQFYADRWRCEFKGRECPR